MKLDKYQQLVIDCNSNAVVSAGAGSGKTTVLARRFLRLIEEDRAGVSEILTLTFTRKAAAEMYERIYSLLLDHLHIPASAAAVADFDKASISTLDSFCSRIARDCSSSFGLPSSFKTDEAAVRTLAEETSLDFILKHSENKFLKEFIFINGFENVWKNFFVHISMNYLSLGEPKDFDRIFKHQMETAEAQLEKLSKDLESLATEISVLEPVSKAIADAQTLISASAESSAADRASVLLGLKKPGGAAVKVEIIRCKEIIDQLRPAAELCLELMGTLENRELIEGLFKLTADFQDELFARKRTAGLLGFHDVLTIAVSGLKQDKSLRRYYKGLFRYIMIDEFQDNNSLQKELLYLLAEADGVEGDRVPDASELNPSKLFFVGDEKQSIYRFRGADVSVFKQLRSELKAAGGESLTLKKNYRSEPGLIDFFNHVFEHVMRDSNEAYTAAFEPLESRDAVLSDKCDIKLLYKPHDPGLPDDSLTAEESEAYKIADYILESIGNLEIAEKGELRKAGFSDFALLFRSGTNQKSYEQVFREKGIPYTVHSVRSLFQEAPVNDIYNILQICLYPEDRTASAAFLRSPLINLSDLSVVEFILSKKPVFAEGQQECCISEEDLKKYLRAGELYEKVLACIDREPIAGIISQIWFGSGYRYLILSDASMHGYLEYYDYLHGLAESFDSRGQSMADFLDHIRENLGDYKKIDELKVLGYAAGGVRIMPVHQSKGLEFPIVIVANSGNKGVNDRGGSTPAYISPIVGLTFNLVNEEGGATGSARRCNYFFRMGKDENKSREEAELRRLLYVALTRAENHLVISGCHGHNNRSGEGSMLNMFLSAFGWVKDADPFACADLEPHIELIDNIRWTSKTSGRDLADISAVSQLYKSAKAPEYQLFKNEYAATAINTELREAESSESDDGITEGAVNLPGLKPEVETLLSDAGLEAQFGTLCHRIIEWIIKSGGTADVPTAEDVSDVMRPFNKSLNENQLPLILEEGIGLAKVFFDSEIWKSIDGMPIESELPFTASLRHDDRDVYVNGVIDIVYETDKYAGIIDFKTDRRIIPGEYDHQMQIYIDAVSEIFAKPVCCSLYYLRGGVEVKIKDVMEDLH